MSNLGGQPSFPQQAGTFDDGQLCCILISYGLRRVLVAFSAGHWRCALGASALVCFYSHYKFNLRISSTLLHNYNGGNSIIIYALASTRLRRLTWAKVYCCGWSEFQFRSLFWSCCSGT